MIVLFILPLFKLCDFGDVNLQITSLNKQLHSDDTQFRLSNHGIHKFSKTFKPDRATSVNNYSMNSFMDKYTNSPKKILLLRMKNSSKAQEMPSVTTKRSIIRNKSFETIDKFRNPRKSKKEKITERPTTKTLDPLSYRHLNSTSLNSPDNTPKLELRNNNNPIDNIPVDIRDELTSQDFLRNAAQITVNSTKLPTNASKMDHFEQFLRSVSILERKFYALTFAKLTSKSPLERQQNGISFVQSGLFLHLALLALSTEVDLRTKMEIENCLELEMSNTEKIDVIKKVMTELPLSSNDLRFRRASRLVLREDINISSDFFDRAAQALQLHIERLNTSDSHNITAQLNQMVYTDSGGAMQNTFDEEEVSEGVHSVLITTLYIRGRWRSAPTLLNGAQPFYDADHVTPRSTSMIRINDVMRYADLSEWDAQAIEVSYITPGLTLLILVPRGLSLRQLADRVSGSRLDFVTDKLRHVRVAATLPLYTLRMTLLLPSKLQPMGISRLVEINNKTNNNELRLSHAIQRLMFWAEAGRHAFKDDGIEWDEPAEVELVVNRPYIFFVRWRNLTLVNGNFVL